MINPTTPHILTIPVSDFSNEIECTIALDQVAVENTSKSNIFVCLEDIKSYEQITTD
jgi:hypothetical protein|tara:strand:+ start:2703 stop:2873 length:171 start_codon:yes stop_codon:yes gene_type:complete